MPLILGEANCGLAHLCFKMGEWAKGREYLHEAELLLEMKEEEITVRVFKIKITLVNVRMLLFNAGLFGI